MAIRSYRIRQTELEKANKFINKFMPLERALNLLNNKAFWFANPYTWQDPYEKYFLLAKYKGKSFAWKKRVFCTCFTENATSEASWNAYANGEVCIQFTFDRALLFNALNQYSIQKRNFIIILDRVEYMQTKNIEKKDLLAIPFDPQLSPGVNMQSNELKARLLLLKRKAFEYENEYRVIIVKEKAKQKVGFNVPVPNLMSIIKTITIDPHIKDDTFKMLSDIFVNTYGFNAKQVQRSYLYKNTPPKKYS